MKKRYTVSLEANPFLKDTEPGREFFTLFNTMSAPAPGMREGLIQAQSAQVQLKGHKLLGEESDFVVAEFEESDRLSLLKTYPTLAIDEDVPVHMAMFS